MVSASLVRRKNFGQSPSSRARSESWLGRPPADRLALGEQVALVLRDDPDVSANAVHRRVGGRRSDVLRAVRAISPLPVALGAAVGG
jgi:hypothetical protein